MIQGENLIAACSEVLGPPWKKKRAEGRRAKGDTSFVPCGMCTNDTDKCAVKIYVHIIMFAYMYIHLCYIIYLTFCDYLLGEYYTTSEPTICML